MMDLKTLTDKIKNIGFINRLELDNQKIILIALVSVAVFYVDFNFIFKAQLKSLDKTGSEITMVKKGLDNFKKDYKNMQELKSRQASLPQKAAPRAKKIISESQIAQLLQDISKTANSNEVRIIQLRPAREIPGSTSQVKAVSGLMPFYIVLDLTSGYHNLGKFINELENMQAFVGVRDIKIVPLADNYLKQVVTLTLYTYVKK